MFGAVAVGAGLAGAGAVRVQIGASSLLQRQPVRMAVASIRCIGHKDVIVYFRY